MLLHIWTLTMIAVMLAGQPGRAEAESAPGVPILLYHAIVADEADVGYGATRLASFRAQLDYLHAHGYRTLDLDQLYDYVTIGVAVPERSIVLTFDDTNESDYTVVFPELGSRGMIGVFFAIGSRAATGEWPNRLREMHGAGMQIASHTMNHLYMGGGPQTDGVRLLTVCPQVVRYELEESRRAFEQAIGASVRYLAWPGDSYTLDMVRAAEDAGYRGICIAKTAHTANIMRHPRGVSGLVSPGTDVMHLPRITVHGGCTMDEFIAMVKDGAYPRPLGP